MRNKKYHFKSHNKNKIAYDTCDIVLVGIVLDVTSWSGNVLITDTDAANKSTAKINC